MHARGDDHLTGRRPGHEHFLVAIAVDIDAEQVDRSNRFLPRAANDPDRGLAFVLSNRRSRYRRRRRLTDRALDDQRGGRAERQRTRIRRLQAGAEGSRGRCRLRRKLAQHDLECLLGGALKPCLVAGPL